MFQFCIHLAPDIITQFLWQKLELFIDMCDNNINRYMQTNCRLALMIMIVESWFPENSTVNNILCGVAEIDRQPDSAQSKDTYLKTVFAGGFQLYTRIVNLRSFG